MCMRVSTPESVVFTDKGKGLMGIATSVSFPALDAKARDAAIKASNVYADGLRELAPDTGAYVNEVSFLSVKGVILVVDRWVAGVKVRAGELAKDILGRQLRAVAEAQEGVGSE
jgi:hypothetical protein